MKKPLLVLAFVFCTTYTSQAQYWGGPWFCFDCYSSIEVGGISSTIFGMEDSSAKLGFYIGFYQYIDISDSFAFRSGLSYNNLGAEIEGFDNPLVIHSINFPLSVHYIYKETFQGFVGGELGTNFFGKLPVYESADSFDHSFEFRDNFTFFDASVFFGVGYIIADNIDINLRYNLGVTNISKNPIQDWKKNWLTLSAAYTFRY